jgi:hypothetical protein
VNNSTFERQTLLFLNFDNFNLHWLIANLLVGWVVGATVIFGTTDFAT